MGTPHLSPELLSAFADGECSPDEGRAANEHLFACTECRSSFEAFRALDLDLQRAPQVECEVALPLISAHIDGEIGAPEAAVVERHVESCASCRSTQAAWSSIPAMLSSLPAGSPSESVDRAIAGLTRRERRPSLRPVLMARGAVALTAAVTIVIAALSRGAAPVTAVVPSDDRVLVAAAQQVVLNASTNTLYVLDTAGAAVDARDAATSALKVHIEVGGQPTALALNSSTNTVLVLDASQKRVTEIDGASNTVVGFAAVPVNGTPTSISVEPTGGRIIVTSTAAVAAASAGANASGSFVVLDAATKQVEAVHDVSIAPQTMIFDATGSRAALVSVKETTLLDESYKVVGTLPGGVAAAFAQGTDRVAVLTQTADGSLVVYGGNGAPASLRLAGSPRAITALPGGGFLVLVQVGAKSRVSYVAPDGSDAGDVDLGISGKALAYDAAAQRFTVVSGEKVVSSSVPTQLASAATPPASSAPPSAGTSPSQSPSSPASASPSPSPSASPSASPTATPGIVAAKPTPNNGLQQAEGVSADLIRFALPGGRLPLLVTKGGERLWVLDDANQVETIDMTSGDTFVPVTLPSGAQISQLKAGRAFVYGLDASAGVLYVVNVRQERAVPHEIRLLKSVTSAVVGLDDRLWMGVRGAPYLLAFDPNSGNVTSFDLGPARISALTIDSLGRIFYADDARSTAGTFDPTTLLLNEVPLGAHGATTSLVVDGSSTLWLSTSTGEVFTVRGGRAALAVSLHRPITTLSVDQTGHVWYLAPLPAGAFGFGFAALDEAQAGSSVRGPVASLDFNALGRAWLADPRGGFYVSRERLR